jgi:hypothetical protein
MKIIIVFTLQAIFNINPCFFIISRPELHHLILYLTEPFNILYIIFYHFTQGFPIMIKIHY